MGRAEQRRKSEEFADLKKRFPIVFSPPEHSPVEKTVRYQCNNPDELQYVLSNCSYRASLNLPWHEPLPTEKILSHPFVNIVAQAHVEKCQQTNYGDIELSSRATFSSELLLLRNDKGYYSETRLLRVAQLLKKQNISLKDRTTPNLGGHFLVYENNIESGITVTLGPTNNTQDEMFWQIVSRNGSNNSKKTKPHTLTEVEISSLILAEMLENLSEDAERQLLLNETHHHFRVAETVLQCLVQEYHSTR